ncbi:MAG: hypothetical protein LR015_02355 [Verrucomicrobia bacterium]|nr:hypothetical protein [Verrucomicrobiota bacterium]
MASGLGHSLHMQRILIAAGTGAGIGIATVGNKSVASGFFGQDLLTNHDGGSFETVPGKSASYRTGRLAINYGQIEPVITFIANIAGGSADCESRNIAQSGRIMGYGEGILHGSLK